MMIISEVRQAAAAAAAKFTNEDVQDKTKQSGGGKWEISPSEQ
jgi:hypothetical protein